MRSVIMILATLVVVAMMFQPSESHLQLWKERGLGGKHYGSNGYEKEPGGTALAAVISNRKFGLGLKALLLKPLLLVALAKIKLALLLGKPLVLLAIKKLLLKAVLGKLLLKIPLILIKGKALLAKALALKFALIAKGLIGLKAPLAMLFLGACALGSGVGLALALGATLGKLKEDSYEEDDYYGYDDSYALPPPPQAYGPPSYTAPSYSAPSYSAPAYNAPSYSAPAYAQAPPAAPAAQAYGSSSDYAASANTYGRKKRDVYEDDSEESEESDEEINESPEELRLQFEAARTNGNAYIFMAAQFDEQSCGRRLMCEVYQKQKESLTEDEILLQEIFGYPLPELSEDDKGTPKEMYYRAAQIGASYQGRAQGNICARFYPTCPHNSQQLISIFVNDDVNTNEIDTDRPSNHLQPPKSTVRLPFYNQIRPAVTPAKQQHPVNKVHAQPAQPQKIVTRQPVHQQVRATGPVQQQTHLRQRLVASAA